MALFRALESAQPRRRRKIDDPFASRFLRPKLRLIATLARVPPFQQVFPAIIDHRWPGSRTSGVARTRFIDEVIDAKLATGIDQVIVLGAGFDARAYRMPGLGRTTVFEVDHPTTSAAKRRLVTEALGTQPEHVRYVTVDFEKESLADAMASAGFDSKRRCLVIWEGVTNYLTPDAVDGTLRWCATTAPDSVVVFTYVHRRVLDSPESFEGTEHLLKTLSGVGEGWHFGLDPAETPAYLAERGFELEQDVAAAEYRARCYGAEASRMRGYEFYRIAVARTASHLLSTE
jgi:methyltransferase (TIGR00027 family)